MCKKELKFRVTSEIKHDKGYTKIGEIVIIMDEEILVILFPVLMMKTKIINVKIELNFSFSEILYIH